MDKLTGWDIFLIIIALGWSVSWAIEAWRNVPQSKTIEEYIADIVSELDDLYDELKDELEYEDNDLDIQAVKSKIAIREEALRTLLNK